MDGRGRGQVSRTSVFRDAIRTRLVLLHSALPPNTLVRSPPKEMDEKETDLAKGVLGLLEVLCWGALDHLDSR